MPKLVFWEEVVEVIVLPTLVELPVKDGNVDIPLLEETMFDELAEDVDEVLVLRVADAAVS